MAKQAQTSLVGVKVGASQLAAAQIANNGRPELLRLARRPLPAGVVAGGDVVDPEALAGELRSFFAEHGLPTSGVRVGIANNRIGVRHFDLTGIDDRRQLDNAVRFRAQEALPIPIEQAVLDYRVLSERVDEQGASTRRILLVVAYGDLIDRYLTAFRSAGITLAGIDLEAFALLRSLAPPAERAADATPAALVAVSMGFDRSTFAVSDGQVCEFTRVLEWGGASLDAAVARALGIDPAQADAVKRALGLDETAGVPEGTSAEQALAARAAMREQVQGFARDLVSSLQYYQGQPGSLGIAELVLTGGTAELAGLAPELQRLIGVGVRVADPLGRVHVSGELAGERPSGSLSVAIGLGIED